jgi:hypothetical protein
MNFLNNFALNLRATGPAAVIIAWMVCVTLLGLFGTGTSVIMALSVLSIAGGFMFASLGKYSLDAICHTGKQGTEEH